MLSHNGAWRNFPCLRNSCGLARKFTRVGPVRCADVPWRAQFAHPSGKGRLVGLRCACKPWLCSSEHVTSPPRLELGIAMMLRRRLRRTRWPCSIRLPCGRRTRWTARGRTGWDACTSARPGLSGHWTACTASALRLTPMTSRRCWQQPWCAMHGVGPQRAFGVGREGAARRGGVALEVGDRLALAACRLRQLVRHARFCGSAAPWRACAR